MFHKQFIFRQLTKAKSQSFIFVLCVGLSMVTLVALTSFKENINHTLLRDAKQLHAADIIIKSRYKFTQPLEQEIAQLVEQGLAEVVEIHEFYSVVRVAEGEETLLSNLKVVEPGYPFYGQVVLASEQPFSEVLTPGQIIVEQNLLDRLSIARGDPLKIGAATLTINDVVTHEPDRPVDFFALGPRIFVHADDLTSLDLLKVAPQLIVECKIPLKRYMYIGVSRLHQLNRWVLALPMQ